ncbi:MAG: acetate kinase [Spirochaetales bacterium]|nr:acetate kinase [Spirochaetales bacterium]
MNILVINTGSSSIKYQLFDPGEDEPLASGLLERIGETGSRLLHRSGAEKKEIQKNITDHEVGMQEIVACLAESAAEAFARIGGIGHRVVHGGELFRAPVKIDESVLVAIEEHIPLAPLHNPANLAGIRAAAAAFPSVPQVAVFDTAFHASMPDHSYRYAIPPRYYQRYAVRRYGFHGTSHQFVARRAAEYLGRPLTQLNMITLHLGNGCSAAAIKHGVSVDTSMGMTPLEGLVMGTRSGDIDPAVHLYLSERTGLTLVQVDRLLNKESGLKGLYGSNDMRDILQAYDRGDDAAKLAVSIYCYRIKKYIGAYLAVLGRLDAIVFTAGVGENAALIRRESLGELEGLGIVLDPVRNQSPEKVTRIISADGSVPVLVVPTNEEQEIARQTAELLAF